jgi:hypothetical protein
MVQVTIIEEASSSCEFLSGSFYLIFFTVVPLIAICCYVSADEIRKRLNDMLIGFNKCKDGPTNVQKIMTTSTENVCGSQGGVSAQNYSGIEKEQEYGSRTCIVSLVKNECGSQGGIVPVQNQSGIEKEQEHRSQNNIVSQENQTIWRRRIEKEMLEKERLEKERLEKERLEKERLEKERLERERLEKERLEKEREEKKRLIEEKLKKLDEEREKIISEMSSS